MNYSSDDNSTINLPAIAGMRFGDYVSGGQSGIKYRDRSDVLLIEFINIAAVAGVFTTSAFAAAPVYYCQQNLSHGWAKALIVNAGNANAFTGVVGHETVQQIIHSASRKFNCPTAQIFTASTGVIGEPLNHQPITDVIDNFNRETATNDWLAAAKAITTTDITIKTAYANNIKINDETFAITAIAKGSGMIEPDMATMLAFIFTDAPIAPQLLQTMVNRTNDKSFNCITVDGDQSTNDTVMAFATGKGSKSPEWYNDDNDEVIPFEQALQRVMIDLACQIVKDGEGASKFVTINVKGASDNDSAKKVAKSIANSLLVKTAIAGEDANWGRIVMAVGKQCDQKLDNGIKIWFGDLLVADGLSRADSYDEKRAGDYMANDKIDITVDLCLQPGTGTATVWTCDLTKQYIAINADYRS